MSPSVVKIRKRNGEYSPFDQTKLESALIRSGASKSLAQIITDEVASLLTDGMSTHHIYQIAYRILRQKSAFAAGRYKLKKAMLELGPTGYPFEKFVGKLLEASGYSVEIGQLINGKCVQHEVDVVARKDNKLMMVECKYHSDERSKSDVQVALYIHSRFRDLEAAFMEKAENKALTMKGMLVTNARFSEDAMTYGICSGIRMISWDFPKGRSLKDWIDEAGLFPITVLHHLRKQDKIKLLDKGIILCRQLIAQTDLLESVIHDRQQLKKLRKEVDVLLQNAP